jgi:ABC-type microcin C transport system permease subunit YejE
MNEENPYTGYEQEVIFPMNKAYIIDEFYGTLEEFKKYVKAT